MAKVVDYKNAGVDVNEGYKAVDKYKVQSQRARIPGQLTELGAFNGMFAIPKGMKNPIMVSGTDGVGTKLDIAFQMKKYDTVGIDCVAMSVNDILCSGVQTNFFLDYIACGKLDAKVAGELVKGVTDGCLETGCALLGGETAEMPGFYDDGKYDLAGFGVGVVDKVDVIDGKKIKEGDVLIGLSSTGPHSNGYSLIRKLVKNFNEIVKIGGKDKKIGDVLLTPTRIYVKPVMEVLKKFPGSVHGMVHVTGGGFYENLPRMYQHAPEGKKQLCSMIKKDSWKVPEIFDILVKKGADPKNMFNTFNMGIGLVLAVSKKDAEAIMKMFNKNAKKYHKAGIEDMVAYEIGYVGHTDKAIKGDFKGSKEMTQFID
ncbi:phosphoribosylformylglycinamidine cyclo-ligase [Treponema sp.]|uniref:phosphoribosylformylglycinamidine cyclo-ligase n=1 Tax=Treponema sp. TaxID=166 RepID=UPI00298D97D8|nr:phosphoribosylformylglycinamidine cyclo-ligase [Treponema sp.]MCQ2240736.1 phosphoribosylformylglycinamidine cyclo-ligase [Treponema sp.]